MGKMIKTYRVFTKPLYRVLMLLVVPLALVALGVLLGEAIAAVAYIMIDVIADYWVFGGICSKYSEKLDYIKSSQRGDEFLKKGMRLDRARSFLELAVIFAMTAAIRVAAGTPYGFSDGFLMDATAALTAYTTATLAYNASRYVETLQLLLVVAYAGAILGLLLCIGCYFLAVQVPILILVLLLAVAAVLVSFFTEKHMMYRLKKSYWDGGSLL
jgi:hypothetical protein